MDKKLSRPLKTTHISTGLDTGGAETMLYKLLATIDTSSFEPSAISLIDVGEVGERIKSIGVPVYSLGMKRGSKNPAAFVKLVRLLKREAPDLLHTWMYHADLLGGLAMVFCDKAPVVWGIRHSDLDPVGNKKSTIWTAKICALLSRLLPDRIVCCSEASRRVHEALGYDAEKMVVIPNGFDSDLFAPNPSARLSVRREIGIRESDVLIGFVGRFDPQKDHRTFIRAAKELARREPTAQFLLCGSQISWDNAQLKQWICEAGLKRNFHLLGARTDIPRITAAFDIATVSSSYGEGFPNVIGEAMASGVPCVVTDVGDSASIVGDTGIVVPPRDRSALAAGWDEMVRAGREGRRRLGEQARQRVAERFSLPAIVKSYEALYRELTS